jgi:hypothetical protein
LFLKTEGGFIGVTGVQNIKNPMRLDLKLGQNTMCDLAVNNANTRKISLQHNENIQEIMGENGCGEEEKTLIKERNVKFAALQKT